jgi:lipid II:glycine glycyltransferase (peptidoglycan interpeptide bridge formation enzyme)
MVSIPFSDHTAILLKGPEEFYLVVDALKCKMQVSQCRYVELRPTQDMPFEDAGFTKAAPFYLHTIDLDRGLDSIYRRFHKDCVQRKIRRSEREGLSYSEGRHEEMLEHFYGLLLMTHKRHHTPPQPRLWFSNLAASLGERMTVRIASKHGKPIAAIVTLTYKNAMTYKYGCSDARFHGLGGMASLLWRSIQEAKTKGMQVFDLGRSDISHTGLIAFKEHWGAERRPLRYWRYSGETFKTRHRFEFNTLKNLLPLAPNAVLRLGGPFLYRHIA